MHLVFLHWRAGIIYTLTWHMSIFLSDVCKALQIRYLLRLFCKEIRYADIKSYKLYAVYNNTSIALLLQWC